jgi:hypothetical protein
MMTVIFWDIENVSIHNLERIMDRISGIPGNTVRYVVYSKIKEARKQSLLDNGWILTDTGQIGRNSADIKIKEMIDDVLCDENRLVGKIIIISEDKGFYKIAKRIKEQGIGVEVICGTKSPGWVERV